MSQERLSMRKISEVLRLEKACYLTNRAIARSCQIAHSQRRAGILHAVSDDKLRSEPSA